MNACMSAVPATHCTVVTQELEAKKEARRTERRKNANTEYAARATKRVEDWMASEAEQPKATTSQP